MILTNKGRRLSSVMIGLRAAGVLGASVVVAGGVVYLIWNYASSSGEKKPESRPGQDGVRTREEGEGKEGENRREEAEETVVPATAPVVAAAAPHSSEVT